MDSPDDPLRFLTLQFLQWVADAPRRYRVAMEAWRTSCPRLPVWEEAVEKGLVRREAGATLDDAMVVLTPRGREALGTMGLPERHRQRGFDVCSANGR